MAKVNNPVRGAIKHIHINFDLKPLIKRLETQEDFFLRSKLRGKEYFPSLYKGVAAGARAKILQGRVTPKLAESTEKIRKAKGKLPGPPLFRSGKLYKSIHAKKDGVYVIDYGIDHLEGYEIKPGTDDVSKHWKRPVEVPARNFLPDSATITLSKKDSQHMYRKINRIIRRKGR